MYDKSIPFDTKVRWIKRESRDTSTYAVTVSSRDILKDYRFAPGQFNMLSIPGIGEAPISISSAPSDHLLMHTVRFAGDVTNALSELKTGDTIGMRGPFGRGWPLEGIEEKDLMIIAGGLGIAPLRSVVRHLFKGQANGHLRKDPGPKRILLYGAKTPKDLIFRDEFPRYRELFEVFLTVDRADPEEYWKGSTGLVTGLFDKISFYPPSTTVFVCGPEIMMQMTVKELIVRGVPEDQIYISMERNMNCGMGICGHCFYGPKFVCKDGPVFRFTDIEELWGTKEL